MRPSGFTNRFVLVLDALRERAANAKARMWRSV